MKKLVYLFLLATITAFGQTVPSYVPTNGLVGWWPFNGNANDESGNGNNGTINGATLTTDRLGNTNSAYSFDGVNDFIDISNTTGLSSSQGLSLSIWTKNFSPNGTTNHQYLYLIGSNPNARITIADNLGLSGSILNCNCSSDLVSTFTINPTSWTHVVLTYNLSIGEQNLFINGVLVDSKIESMTSYYTTNNNAKRFGSYGFNEYFFKGILDDAALWNRTLNSQEVLDLYNGGCLDSLTIQPQNTTAYTNPGWANFTTKHSDTTATYQWQLNSGTGWANVNNFGNYSGATSDSLVITGVTTAMNNYGYRCIVTSCNTDTSNVAVLSVTNGIGLGESTLQKLTVSPNPTTGLVSLNSSVIGSYELLALDGRVLESGTAKKDYDLSQQPNGVYNLKLTTADGTRVLKIVKN